MEIPKIKRQLKKSLKIIIFHPSMENYYLVNYNSKVIEGPFLYSNGAILTKKDGKLIIEEDKRLSAQTDSLTIIEDSFSEISFFMNYEYEFLIIENNSLHLVNKHTKEISLLGSFTDKITDIFSNTKYTLVLTEKSLIAFSNEYFDIISEMNHEGNILKGELSTDDTFILIFSDKIEFYNINMEKLGDYEISCDCACFIERYNYWCVLNERDIHFIEENGCLYNKIDNKEGKATSLYSKDKMIIVNSESKITILNLMDGHWQYKMVSELNGQFLAYYNDKVVIENGEKIQFYFINKEYARLGNIFLVVDYSDVLIYNFNIKKSAMHDFKMKFKKPIQRIFIDRDEFGIQLKDQILFFDKDFNFIKKKEASIVGMCLVDRNILYKEDILNIHNLDGNIFTVKFNGEIVDSDNNTVIKVDPFVKKYELAYKNEVLYVFYDNRLITTTATLSGITSFFISDSLLYTKQDKLIIDDTFIITDTDFRILGTTDLEIYGISRFNSIDTYYNKEYIKKQIIKYFEKEEYLKSIEMMIKHNLKINMENINVEKMKKLSTKYIYYIIDEIITDYKLIIEDDFVYILNKVEYKDTWINSNLLSNDRNKNEYTILFKEYIKKRSIKTKSNITDFIDKMIRNFKDDDKILNYLFIKSGRVDLALIYTKDLEECIKICKNYISKDEIKRNALLCYEIGDVIEEVCRLLNEDIHILQDLERGYYKVLEMYKLFDELIYYLIVNKMEVELCQIVEKYNLHDKILIYIQILYPTEVFKLQATNLLNLYVKGVDTEKKILIYKDLNCHLSLLDLYLENNMFEEIFNFNIKMDILEDYKVKVVDNIKTRKYHNNPEVKKYHNNIKIGKSHDNLEIKKYNNNSEINKYNNNLEVKKYHDLGLIYEKYLFDFEASLNYFVKSGSIRDIYRIHNRLENGIRKINLINVVIEQFSIIEKIRKKLNKYIKRLHNIQHDLDDENFSVTSVCRTNRGIPGNLYEYEFYLEKINELLIKISNWTEESKMILEIEFNKELSELLEDVRSEVKDVPMLYEVGYERSKEKIECIDITKILN